MVDLNRILKLAGVLTEARVVPGVGGRRVNRTVPPVIPSKNEEFGFWGTATRFREDYRSTNAVEPGWTVATLWNETIKHIGEMTGARFSHERIRDWLDTKEGRRLMDTIANYIDADAASVPVAVVKAVRWNYPFPSNLERAIFDMNKNGTMWG